MATASLARQHFDRVLGAGGARVPTVLGESGAVSVLAYPDPDDPMVHCVTVGACELPLTALHPSEFICSVRPGQEEAARFLLASTVEAAQRGARMVLESTITNDTPLLAGTDIRGVLLTGGMWFEGLDVLSGADGRVALHVVTVLPLTGSDIAYLDGHDSDELEEMLDSTGADVLDVLRGTAG